MADTSKREELIEALAAGVHEGDGWMSDAQNARLEWDGPNRVIHFCGQGSIDVGHLAAIALAVFEQAHTPTDDEREALRDELAGWVIGAGYYQSMVGTSDAAEMADAILAAGFRRTVQGEPTDAQVEAALQALGHARSAVTAPVMRAALRAAAGATNRENGSAEQ